MQLTIRQLFLPALALTGFALLQTLALLPVAGIDFLYLLPDSMLHSLGCGMLALPLLNVVRFSRLHSFAPTLRFVNYSAYVAVATTVAVGTVYLAELLIFGTHTTQAYVALLPLRALLNACIFTGILVCVKKADTPDQSIDNSMDVSTRNDIQSESERDSGNEITTISYTTRIALRSGTKIHVVSIDEVLYMQADGDYVQVVTPQGRFLKEQTLKSFAEQLPPDRFVRVHRSILVNAESISRIERYEKNTQQLRLKNGDTVKVSQQGYKLLRQQLGL